MLKKFILSLFMVAALVPVGHHANASILDANNQLTSAGAESGFNTTRSLADSVGLIIKAFIGILGVVFLVLTISAGFTWMTAQGDEKKVSKAKGTLVTAVIGLVICLSAYSIASFVISQIESSQRGVVSVPY